MNPVNFLQCVGVGRDLLHIPVRSGPRINTAFEARILIAVLHNVSLHGFLLL